MVLNKKGQVGETVTWIFATVVIIVILGISLAIAEFYLGENKDIGQTNQVDILASKSFFSYLLTDDVYGKIKSSPDGLDGEAGKLASDIFEEFYGKEYLRVWLGIRFNRTLSPYKSNDYFKSVPIGFTGGDVGGRGVPLIKERINLDEEKSVELVLKPKT